MTFVHEDSSIFLKSKDSSFSCNFLKRLKTSISGQKKEVNAHQNPPLLVGLPLTNANKLGVIHGVEKESSNGQIVRKVGNRKID